MKKNKTAFIKRLLHRLSKVVDEHTHLAVFIIIMLAGLLYIISTPLLWGLDEVAHFNRALEVSRGQVIPQQNSKGEVGNNVPSSLSEIEYLVYNDLLDDSDSSTTSRKDVSSASVYWRLGSRELSTQEEPTRITASYSPVAYVGPSIGIFIGEHLDLSITKIVFLGRFVGLLTYAMLVAASIYILRRQRTKWVLIAISLFPVAVFQASTVSADTLSNGVAFLIFAIVYRFLVDKDVIKNNKTKKQLVIVACVLAIIVPLIKSNNIFISALVLLIPNLAISQRKWLPVFVKTTVMVCASIAAVVWTKLSTALDTPASSMRADGVAVDPAGQVGFVITHPLGLVTAFFRSLIDYGNSYIDSTIGLIGWNLSPLPVVFEILAISGVAVALIYAKNEILAIKTKKILFFAGVAALGVLSSFFVMYLAFTPVGYPTIDGVNGRYFIPYLAPLLIAASVLLPSLRLSGAKVRDYILLVSIINLLVSLSIYLLVTY